MYDQSYIDAFIELIRLNSDVKGIMVSVNPPYAEMLLSRYKTFLFRESVLCALRPENLRQSGPVTIFIYEAAVNGGRGAVVGEIQAHHSYCPNFLIDTDYSEAGSLWEEQIFDYKRRKDNKTFHFHGKKPADFEQYRKEIGSTPKEYNYAVRMQCAAKYKEPIPITNFYGPDGKPLTHPPQNMCFATKPHPERSV